MDIIVIDSNAALLPFTDKTRVHDELDRLVGTYELVMPQGVDDELTTLASRNGQTAVAASAALRLFGELRRERTTLPGDDGILEIAAKLDAIILTNDKAIQGQARNRKLRVIGSRGRGRLAWLSQ